MGETIINGIIEASQEIVGKLQYAREAINTIPQSDWQQNDETANDYVKNRPGGYDVLTEIVSETTLNFTSNAIAFTDCPSIEVGKTYTVTFYKPETDKTEYELVGKNDSKGLGYTCIGNETYTWDSDGTDTGEPFLIYTTGSDITSIIINSSETFPCTYNIKIKAIAPIKIDEKYLGIKNTNIVNGSKIGSLRTVGSSIEGSEYEIGDYAFAEGMSSKASGNYSHAEGMSSKASSNHQHVQGKYNIEDSNNIYADIIGNGSSDTKRSNAATVDWDGNAWYAGDVYVGSTSGTNRDEGSKKLATEIYANTVSANAIKDSVSGLNAVQITDKNNNLCPITHEMGVKVRSKNLIPYPYSGTSSTMFGVTFTVNSDGSVTVNGTATANAVFELETDPTMFTLPVGNYFLSGCPIGGSPTNYFMIAVNGAGISYDKFLRDFGNGISVPSKGEKWKISIRIMSGYTADNLVFKPQIELGTTATAYTPYISDFSTVNVTRCGKNLFNQSLLTDWGLVLTDGKYVGAAANLNGKTLASNFQNNTQYTISLKGYNTNSTEASILISVNYTDGTSATIIRLTAQSETEYKFTSEKGKTVSSFKSAYYNADTVNISYIQIEQGSTVTAYEPYQGQTYTPTADGTVSDVKSLYPTTTLMTNTEGAIIDCEYNVDLNSALDNINNDIGDINTALDSIIEMQNSLIGGN